MAAPVTLPTLDNIPAIAISLVGLAVAYALAVFVIDTATQIDRKERDHAD